MNYAPRMNRRSFVIGTAAVGGGLALGLELPFGPRGARGRSRRAGSQCMGGDPA